MNKTILYEGREITVSEEVAEFLEQDRKRQQAEGRSDGRHRDLDSIENAEKAHRVNCCSDPVFSELIRKEAIDKLHKVWRSLDGDSWWLIRLYYFEGRSFEEIGEIFGITKMAVSKRHRKLLVKMRELMAT